MVSWKKMGTDISFEPTEELFFAKHHKEREEYTDDVVNELLDKGELLTREQYEQQYGESPYARQQREEPFEGYGQPPEPQPQPQPPIEQPAPEQQRRGPPEIIPSPFELIGDVAKKIAEDPKAILAAGAGMIKGALLEKAVPYISTYLAKEWGGEVTMDIPYKELLRIAREEGIGSSKQIQKRYPKAFLAGEIAGGIGGPLTKVLGPAGVVGGKLGKGFIGQVTAGGITGAAYGAAYAEKPRELPGMIAIETAIGAGGAAAIHGALRAGGMAWDVIRSQTKKGSKAVELKKQIDVARREIDKDKITKVIGELDDNNLSYIDVVDPASSVIKSLPNRVFEKETIPRIKDYSKKLSEGAEKAKQEMLDMISENQINDEEAALVIGKTMSDIFRSEKRMRSAKTRPIYERAFMKEAGKNLLPDYIDADYVKNVLTEASVPAPKRGMRLLTFLRHKGGIRETELVRGELTRRDINRKTFVGLVNKNGRDLDDAGLIAWEAGYIPGDDRPTVNELLDYIDQDFRYKNVYNHPDFNSEVYEASQENASMIGDILGIQEDEWKSITTERIDRLLKNVKPRYVIPENDPLLKTPAIKNAIREARKISNEYGPEVVGSINDLPDNSLAVLHQAKKILYSNSKSPSLEPFEQAKSSELYHKLSEKLRNLSPEYKKASDIWKGDAIGSDELRAQTNIGRIADLYDKRNITSLVSSLKNVFDDSIRPYEIERMKRFMTPEQFNDIVRKDLTFKIAKSGDTGSDLTKALFGKTESEEGLRGKRLDLLFTEEQKKGLKKMTKAIDRAKELEKKIAPEKVFYRKGRAVVPTLPTGGKISMINSLIVNFAEALVDSPGRRQAFVDLITSEEGRKILEKAATEESTALRETVGALSRLLTLTGAEILK